MNCVTKFKNLMQVNKLPNRRPIVIPTSNVKESLKTGELVPLEKDQYERGREIYENQRKNTEKLRTNSQSGDLYVTTPARSEACEDRLRDTCDCFDSDRSC